MLTILNDTKVDLIAIRVSGTLGKDDYAQLERTMEHAIEKHGKLRMYCEITGFKGLTPAALLQELKLDLKYANKVSQMAVAGDAKWEEALAQLAKPFTSAAIKFFPLENKAQAKRWIAR